MTVRGVSAFIALAAAVICGGVVMAQDRPPASPPARADLCRVEGTVRSGATALPGASVVVRAGGAVKAATSTDLGGRYTILFTPGSTFHLSVDLTGFAGVARDLTLGAPPCGQTVDFQLALQRPSIPASTGVASAPAAGGRGGAGRGGGGRGGAPGADARGGQGRPGFQTLTVEANSDAPQTPDTADAAADSAGLSQLLPPGFSLQGAQADAIAINGASGATNLDRGSMNDRLQAINLGEINPVTGQLAGGPGGPEGPGGPLGAGGGRGGPGGFGGGRGGFGPGGRGGFLGGRGMRGQSPYQGSATYSFGGSALDSAPYQLRSDVPVTQPQFAKNTFGGTVGGPLRLPGLYADASQRTNFQLNYTGNRSNNVFDQYATVPTDAERAGDFSASPVQLIDPATGEPFANNQIPAGQIDPTSAALLQYLPAPNLPGTTQNYHVSTTARSSSEALSLRVVQNLSANPQAGRGGRGGRGGGFGGFAGRGGPGGRGGPPAVQGTNIVLSGQLQYRRNTTQNLNVFPDLGTTTTNTSLAAPISLNIRHARSVHNVTVNLARTGTETTNAFANVDNVSGLAGIQYPGTTDPLNWGVPNLAFSGFTGVRSGAATARHDDRLTAGYTWMFPRGRHRLRIGGEYRLDETTSDINANARGTFTFTGLYSSGTTLDTGGADFADFLLGLPAQATLQVGSTSHLRQHAFTGFVEDNWQARGNLTLNLGLRYDLALPYVEVNGRMANLDASPDFSVVAPVLPGATGTYEGAFPAGLLNTDANNLEPRVGLAYRLGPGTILRGGYGITYNSGSYASIARELSGQPPFADTETVTGDGTEPLTLAEALLSPGSTTTNNWGVAKDYALGRIQTWNATLTRNLTANWMVQAGYTGIKGSNLDVLRAPGLGPGDTPASGTQPFIWESSGGRSLMNGGTFQIRRRLANGYSGGVSYTLAKSMDDASSLGAGGAVVAQNDKDLAAEWGPSNFDRRHQVAADLYLELPWGPNRHWLKDGGTLADLFGEWSARFTLTLQSGTPLTARVLGAASDLLRGVNGSLRADYTGQSIALPDPTVDEYFNVSAFAAPVPGAFGDSSRNMIVGPGAHQLDGMLQRDLRIGGTRALTIQINALNLLNTVQWAAVDTNINSPTFGQVLSARPMRTVTITARLRF